MYFLLDLYKGFIEDRSVWNKTKYKTNLSKVDLENVLRIKTNNKVRRFVANCPLQSNLDNGVMFDSETSDNVVSYYS